MRFSQSQAAQAKNQHSCLKSSLTSQFLQHLKHKINFKKAKFYEQLESFRQKMINPEHFNKHQIHINLKMPLIKRNQLKNKVAECKTIKYDKKNHLPRNLELDQSQIKFKTKMFSHFNPMPSFKLNSKMRNSLNKKPFEQNPSKSIDLESMRYQKEMPLKKDGHTRAKTQAQDYLENTNSPKSLIKEKHPTQFSRRVFKLKAIFADFENYQAQNGKFAVPHSSQYEDYINSYQSIEPEFQLSKIMALPHSKKISLGNCVYFGEIHNQIRQGKGILISQDSIFEGIFKKNQKLKGSERNIDGVFRGEFVNDKRQGKGEYSWNNGEKYVGDWKQGQKEGHGRWSSPSGDFYQGGWKNNCQHGQAIYKHRNNFYEGNFHHFSKQGNGKQYFANGDLYQGEFEKGKPQGFGQYQWTDGSYYEGYFEKGKREGKGILLQKNGHVYRGHFRNDFKDGEGQQIDDKGNIVEGNFLKGEWVQSKGNLQSKDFGVQIIKISS